MAFKEHSRYRGSTITSVTQDGELRNYTILKEPLEVPENEQDFYVSIDSTNQFKPEHLSFQVYGDVNYGWAIMEINNIRSFLELKTGVRVRIPPIDLIQSAIKDSHDRA